MIKEKEERANRGKKEEKNKKEKEEEKIGEGRKSFFYALFVFFVFRHLKWKID